MSHGDDRQFDPRHEPDDTAAAAALADLERAYAAVPPPALRQAMDRAVHARMAAPPPTDTRRALRLPRAPRLALVRARLLPAVAALLLALSGMASYLRLHGAAPVSARTVLQRAAGALAPGQAAHVTYSVTMTPGSEKLGALTADVWVQADTNGAPALTAQTLTAGQRGALTAYRAVAIDGHYYAYDASHQAILLDPQTRADPSWLLPTGVLDGAGIAQVLATLQQRSPQRVQLLPEQTLDGVQVDVIQVEGWTDRPAQRTTFYFDAQSYLLRGFDAVSDDPSYPTPAWQARLSAYAGMPAASVPARTFSLDAPATARVYAGSPDLGIFAAACHSASNPKDILKAGQESLLDACRATAPTVTQADLVAAFLAPTRAALDAAAAAGQITAAQAADGLARQQAWLATFVSSPGGGAGG